MSMIARALAPVAALLILVACSDGEIDFTPTSPVEQSPTPEATASAPAQTPSATPTLSPTASSTQTRGTPTLAQQTATASPTAASPTPTPSATPPPDRDGDGSPDGEDCAPDDAEIHPGATEVCAAEGEANDEDCDGEIDEGLDADGDGVVDCQDPETCNGDDDDGDGDVDEGSADLDGDGVCDELDPDRDGDRVTNALDPDPDDGSVNTEPFGFFMMPGDGTLHLVATEAAYVDVTVDSGSGPEAVDGGPWELAASETLALPIEAGAVRVGATAPLVGFFVDAADTGDRLTHGLSGTGAASGNTLYVFAKSFVSVVGASGAPGVVKIERATAAGWDFVSSVSLSEGGGTSFAVSEAGIYRVRSSSGTISVYGWALDGTFSGSTYIAGPTGLSGTVLRFTRPAAAPQLSIGVMSTSAPATVNVTRGGVPVQSLNLAHAGAMGLVGLTDVSTYTITSTTPIVAWVEGKAGAAGVDQTLRDVSLVPGVGFSVMDTDFLITANVLTTPSIPAALTDIDVQARDDATLLTASQWTGSAWEEIASHTLDRGSFVEAFSDLSPQALVRLESNQPVTVTQSHGPSQFAGAVWVGHTFTSAPRGEGDSCDVSGERDHCQPGLLCTEGLCLAP